MCEFFTFEKNKKMKKVLLFAVALFSMLSFQSCGDDDDKDLPPLPEEEEKKDDDNKKDDDAFVVSEWNDHADASTDFLVTKYWRNGDSYNFFVRNHIGSTYAGYWPQAHAMDVVIDGYLRNKELLKKTNDQKYYKKMIAYSQYFDKWYAGIYKKNGNRYENHYFDDMEWIALTMIRLYEATGVDKYLNTAKQLWDAIKTGWSDDIGGGLFWRGYDNASEKTTKNACSNGPGSLIACRLWANGVDKAANLEWAKKIFEWEKANLVDNSGKVADNKDLTGKVTWWIFSYNQATYMATAQELYHMTGDRSYLVDACLAANYTLTNMCNNGILKVEGSTNGDDAGLFRAVFMRYFVNMALEEDLDGTTRNSYKIFLYNNSKTLWGTASNGNYYWSRDWTKSGIPSGEKDNNYDMQCQTSGGTLIEARAKYENAIAD